MSRNRDKTFAASPAGAASSSEFDQILPITLLVG
jgi:hypothetical protein